MTRFFTAQAAGSDAYILGEGPVWDPDRNRLLWVDIVAGVVFAGALEPEAGTIMVTDSWSFTTTVGAVATAADGTLLVAERETLTRVDTDGTRTVLARVLREGSRSRLNDGAVDPSGRFVVGSLAEDERRGEEVLVRLESDRGLTTIDADLNLSNGLDWGLDGGTFYSIDTVPGVVRARDYPAGRERRDLFTIADGDPDGMTIDRDGNLWIAIWGGGRVECRSPGGELLAVVETGAPNTTSVVFAGPALDVLVITSATDGLDAKALADAPDSGRLFTADVGVTGRATPYWNPVL
jgi:sugar lactone lactonase YvrE